MTKNALNDPVSEYRMATTKQVSNQLSLMADPIQRSIEAIRTLFIFHFGFLSQLCHIEFHRYPCGQHTGLRFGIGRVRLLSWREPELRSFRTLEVDREEWIAVVETDLNGLADAAVQGDQ